MAAPIVKTLGVDCSDINGFDALVPANLVTADQQWILEFDSLAEYVFTTAQAMTAHTTDATRNIIFRAKTTKGFWEAANVLTNAYFYAATNGAAMRSTYTGGNAFVFPNNFTEIRGLQIQNTGNPYIGISLTGSSSVFEGNIFVFGTAGGSNSAMQASANGKTGNLVRSNLFITNHSGACVDFEYGGTGSAIGNTIISTVANTTSGIAAQFTSNTAKDNAIFGFTNPLHPNLNTNSSYNASNTATVQGTNNLVSLTQANQFVSTSDFRLKAGNALAGAGVAVTGWTTGGLGQTNPTPPQIGATSVQQASAATVNLAAANLSTSATLSTGVVTVTAPTPGVVNLVATNMASNATLATAAVTVTAAQGTLTSDIFKAWGSPAALVGLTVPHVTATRMTDRAQVLSLAGQVTNGAGRVVLVSASLVAGVWYMLGTWNADGSARGFKAYQAT